MPIPGGNITSSEIWTQPAEPVAEPAVEEVVEDSTKEEAAE